MKYDVIIVGAGPAVIFAILEYIKKEFFEGKDEEFEAQKKAIIRISPAKIIKIEITEDK